MNATATGNRRRLSVACADTFNRRRTVGLASDTASGRVVLAAPPGETAVFSPHEARVLAQQLVFLADALDAAHDQHTVTALSGRRAAG